MLNELVRWYVRLFFKLNVCINFTDFNKSFTVVFSDLLLRKMVLKRPSHLSVLPHYLAKLECATVQDIY